MKKFFKSTPKQEQEASAGKIAAKPTIKTTSKKAVAEEDIFDPDISESAPVVTVSSEEEEEEGDELSAGGEEGKLMWAKLQGYPWWPAMVCRDPEQGAHSRSSRQGGSKTHVQFFDQPPTRGWVPSRYCVEYEGADKGHKFLEEGDEEQRVACEAADSHLGQNRKERLEELLEADKENSCREREERRGDERPSKRAKSEEEVPAKRQLSEDEEEENVPAAKRKRKNIIQSDSEDEAPPLTSRTVPRTPQSSGGTAPRKTPTSAPSTPQTPSSALGGTPRTPSSTLGNTPRTPNTAAKLAKFSHSNPASTVSAGATEYQHHTLAWLQPDKIRDGDRKLKSDEDYNPRTLHVPAVFLGKCTPGMKQWWKLKAQYYDVVLFFKVGKFYELYHMDAEVAVRELGLIYMKGSFAHCGFPEKSFARYSETLVQKGYRVARIEQTTRPGEVKGCKTVEREVCAVITKGTKTQGLYEGNSADPQSSYLLALYETDGVVGVCLVDTTVGRFLLSQFSDDRHSSRLRTLLSHYTVAQVLYPRRSLSERLTAVLRTDLGRALHEGLAREKEFWSSSRTLKELTAGNYFLEEGETEVRWPELFDQLLDGESAGSFGSAVAERYQLAVSALGAVVFYLRSCLIERPLLALRSFSLVQPGDLAAEERKGEQFPGTSQRMVLDSVALRNLEVFVTPGATCQDQSVYSLLDKCVTGPGKRLLRSWLCSPLCHPDAINRRLDAVEELSGTAGRVSQIRALLGKVPDLERLLRKIHSQGVRLPPDHPETRAVMFEVEHFSRRRIQDLVNTLDGFEKLLEVVGVFAEGGGPNSELLKSLVSTGSKGFPDISGLLTQYKDSFDRGEALKNGIVLPHPGLNPAYDEATAEIERIEGSFNRLLLKYKKELQCALQFHGSGKTRFQVEVPEGASKRVPKSWEVQSQRKGYIRYYFPESIPLKQELEQAEIRKGTALKDTTRQLFRQFSIHHSLWSRAVSCAATLDVLLSLSLYSSSYETCRPVVKCSDTDEPVLEIETGSHPTLLPTLSPGEFIPNDTTLRSSQDSSLCLVVTGPNMGGKSTLMRQVGLLVLLAQTGCMVPASKMTFTPVDRIFTRLGASDNITKGESTFFVELSETSSILRHATKHSLVLLDELGRGTATYDGTAIAGSVIEALCQEVKCRALFSTHYHRLVDDLEGREGVFLGHMSCIGNSEEDEQDITFLYKLAPGACPKSFGFNAARMAGISAKVIEEAQVVSQEFERTSDKFHLFAKALSCNGTDDLGAVCKKIATVL